MRGIIIILALTGLIGINCSKAPLPTELNREEKKPEIAVGKIFVSAVDENGKAVDSARVYLNSVFIGWTPIFKDSVPLGTHTLRVHKEGFRIFKESLIIQDTSRVFIEALLERLPLNIGQLLITVDQDSATVTVTNINQEIVSQLQTRELALILPPGGYFIEVKKPGFLTVLKAVEIQAGKVTIENIKLERSSDVALPQIVLIVPDSGKVNTPVLISWQSYRAKRVDVDYIENPGLNGRREIIFSTPGMRTISATAYNEAGHVSVEDSVFIYQESPSPPNPPSLNFAVSPDSVDLGEPCYLSWSSDGYQVIIDQGIGVCGPTGSLEKVFHTPGKKVFTAVAYGREGLTTTKKDSVYVKESENSPADPPTIEVNVTPDTTEANETVNISWRSEHATSVCVDYVPNPGLAGQWQIQFPSPGVYVINAHAYGPGGEAHDADTVVVTEPTIEPPTLEFEVSPDSVDFGEPCYISWNSNGYQVVIDQGIGVRPPVGSEEKIFPNPGKKIFTCLAYGENGTTIQAQDSVYVREPEAPQLPIIILAVTDSVQVSCPATIEWHTLYATHVDIDYVQNPGLNGKREIVFNTAGTRVISATAYNQAGQVTVFDTLVVTEAPPSEPQVEPIIIPSSSVVCAIHPTHPAVDERAGEANILVPGYYKVTATIWYNSGDDQRNESLFILVKGSDGVLRGPQDPNAGPYKVVPDDPGPPHVAARNAGTFYFTEGINVLQAHHYWTISTAFPEFLNGPITGPESVYTMGFKLEFLHR